MRGFAAAAASLAAAAAASPAWAGMASDHGVAPWSEAVVSVQNIPAATRLFREAGGWRMTRRGKVERAELDYWRLPNTAKATFERLCAPQAETGCIRFVRFTGVSQRPIRPAARPWDTGGIYSIMIRSDDADALFNRALELGWWAESEPINFAFGGSELRNVVLIGPHGINLAVYQRRSPPFTAFPVGRISQGFNAMRMVRDQKVTLAWYREKLGFAMQFDADYLDPAPQVTNFSVPINYSTTIPRRAAVVFPLPGETGRIELMQFVGFEGRDFASQASPPNLGILSVRYPVRDLAGYRTALEARGVTIVYSAQGIAIGGIGKVDLFAVRDPDGNLTEFYGAD